MHAIYLAMSAVCLLICLLSFNGKLHYIYWANFIICLRYILRVFDFEKTRIFKKDTLTISSSMCAVTTKMWRYQAITRLQGLMSQCFNSTREWFPMDISRSGSMNRIDSRFSMEVSIHSLILSCITD